MGEPRCWWSLTDSSPQPPRRTWYGAARREYSRLGRSHYAIGATAACTSRRILLACRHLPLARRTTACLMEELDDNTPHDDQSQWRRLILRTLSELVLSNTFTSGTARPNLLLLYTDRLPILVFSM